MRNKLTLSLRQRSAFCITVIMMVISQIQDGGSGTSLLTKQCRQHAEHMGGSIMKDCGPRLICSQGDPVLASIGHRDRSSHAYVHAYECHLYQSFWLVGVT